MYQYTVELGKYVMDSVVYEGISEVNEEDIKTPILAVIALAQDKYRKAQEFHNLREKYRELRSK